MKKTTPNWCETRLAEVSSEKQKMSCFCLRVYSPIPKTARGEGPNRPHGHCVRIFCVSSRLRPRISLLGSAPPGPRV